jgi:Transglutaminase-like superfamily
MRFLVLHAYWNLLRCEPYLLRRDFAGLHGFVRRCDTQSRVDFKAPINSVCDAVDSACVWYWKQALCLQRSAATACLLRQQGVPADLVIGVRSTPLRAHAWVEVDGVVVNDRPYMRDIYMVLERC